MQQVAKWVLHDSCSVSHDTIKNAWKDGFEWFPKNVGTAQNLKWYERIWEEEDDEEEIQIPMCAC